MKVTTTAAIATVLFIACAKPQGATSDGSTATTMVDACTPAALGLGSVVQATPWTLPAGCAMDGGNGTATIVTSETELRAAMKCPGNGATGLDFAKQSLVVQSRILSPASVGTVVYDDGKRITFVNRFRSSCPGDPLPMPIGYTLSVLVPAGGDRTFREVSCNVETKCK